MNYSVQFFSLQVGFCIAIIMPNHFHVIWCFYLYSVEDAVLPTEDFPAVPVECMISGQHQTSWILVHGDMELRPIRSVAEANFPTEIHQVVSSVYN